jgi:hypothetical protein
MQAPVRADHVQAGAQPQVEGVAEHDLRADSTSSTGLIAFTVP